MRWAALATWVLTAGGGFVMLGLWLKHGGMEQRSQPGRRIRPSLIFSHFALAAAGLVVWIVYVASHKRAVAWIGFGLLVPVALLGFTMFALWIQRRRLGNGGSQAGPEGSPVDPSPTASTARTTILPAEQRFPAAVVLGHGLLAVATVVLALLAAAHIGGS